MRRQNGMIAGLAGFLIFGMFAPGNAVAVEGHCVAFCDEPAAAPQASGNTSAGYGPGAQQTAPKTQNEIQMRQLNLEGIKEKQLGNYFKALELYRNALGFAKDYPGAERDAQAIKENMAKAQNAVGADSYKRGDYIGAVTWFEFAAASDPHSEVYRDNLRDAKSSLGYHPVYNPSDPSGTSSAGNISPAPVDLRDQEAGQGKLPVIDPNILQKKPTGALKTLRTKGVPLPPAIQKLNESAAFRKDIYDGSENHADMVLDALEKGQGDLDKSIEYMEARVNTEGGGKIGTDALSYLEGLKVGAVAVDADVKPEPDIFKDQELTAMLGGATTDVPFGQDFEEGQLEAAAKMLEEQAAKHGFYTWRVARTKMMLLALEEGRGDIEKSLAYLEKERENLLSSDPQEAENAYRYLQGLRAYPGFQAISGRRPAAESQK